MKHKLQTTLKHKLQWLLLLVSLLGVSQGVWGYSLYVYSTQSNVYVYGWNGISTCINGWPGGKLSSNCFTSLGNNWYKLSTAPTNTFSVIFNNGSGTQTSDITGLTDAWLHAYKDNSYSSFENYGSANTYYLKSSFTDWTAANSGTSFSSFDEGHQAFKYSTTLDANTYTYRIYKSAWYCPSLNNTRGSYTSLSGGGCSNFSFTLSERSNVTIYYDPGSNVSFIDVEAICSTPSSSDISFTAPASATTIYLGSGSAPIVTQALTATCSKGNTYQWSATPTTYTSSSCWSSSAATRVSIANSNTKSATATFYHEGEYTATFKAGCSNTTDASKPVPKITVKPGHIYFDGPFFSGSGYDLTKHHVAINTSTDQFVYEWTATSSNTVANNDFIISVGTSCIDATSAAYTIGNYADLTLNGLVIPDKDTADNTNCNHNFRANIGTINVGDGLKLTIAYTGVNASNVPKYSVTLEKTCSAVSKSQYTMASQTKQWTGSPITPDITKDNNAGTIKNYYYSTDGSTWTSGCPTARGTYYIKIDVNAGSTYCAKDGIILDNTLKITRKSRTISIDNTDVVCGAGSYTITSTASVGSGTKTYSIKSDPSSIASIGESTGELTLTGAGTFTVQVNIAASGNYAAASGTKEFTVTLPTISTSAATGISYASATLNGSVSDVTCTPPSSGFEYKKGSDAYTSVAAASATGSISKEISGLTPGTTYTFRTYTVVNGVTKYSSTRTFTTTSCSAPVISSSSLSAQSKCKDEVGTAMTVTASGGVGTLTYTWYKKNDTTPSGGTQVQSSTSNNYTPPTGTVGTLYYYCVVSSASPCASSTVNSGISGAVEIKAKPTLTKTPSTTHPYQPITFTSDMDADTSLENKGWDSTDDGTTSYFVSKGTRTAVYKIGLTTSARVWVIATNGCSSTQYFFVQTADTEDCTE